MKDKRLQHGFTLIELLVVIAIIAILAAILVPAVTAALNRARTMSCMSNVKQLATAQVAYSSARQGQFFAKATWKDVWLDPLADAYGDVDELRRCPVTKVQKAETVGSKDNTWYWGNFSGNDNHYGSYTFNYAFYSEDKAYNVSKNELFADATDVSMPSATPVFCDGIWPDMRVVTGKLASNLEIGSSADLGRASIARHGDTGGANLTSVNVNGDVPGSINVGFIDGHAATTPLYELKYLSWNKQYKPPSRN